MEILNNSRLLKILFWFWLALIFIVSSIPYLSVPGFKFELVFFRSDYILHWFQYSVLIGLFVVWRSKIKSEFNRRIGFSALLLGIFLASIDETHQIFIPGRHFNPIDMVYNYLGVFTGLLIAFLWIRKQKRDSEKSISL
ncbi:MAG: VanZ family protein [Bacteroidota bacterium]|nr:VanZ family protein [Bacteroidota bacterium]